MTVLDKESRDRSGALLAEDGGITARTLIVVEREPDAGWRRSLSPRENAEYEGDLMRLADDGCPHHA